MFGTIVSAIKIVVISGTVLGALGAFWYVSGLRADLQQSQENVRTLESSVYEQQTLIEQMKRDQQLISDLRDDLDRLRNIQREETQALKNRFDENAAGDRRDIGDLASRRPGLVGNIITNASNDAMRCIEIASGAKLTEEERNAIRKSQINSECSSLANPSYSSSIDG